MSRIREKCNDVLAGLYGCFLRAAPQVGAMSLNRSEQRVFDYVQSHAEERQYWFGKVQTIAAALVDPHAAANRLEGELWRYHQERSAVVPAFREVAQREGIQRTSMKNLAEHLLRLWVAPKSKKPAAPSV
jgi:hypothetical protein